MGGHYTTDTAWKRGRPLTEIPPALAAILDTTHADGRDYVVEADERSEEAQELIRYGKIHARHRGLSFRYYFSEDENGVTYLRFRLSEKRVYVKRNSEYWDGK